MSDHVLFVDTNQKNKKQKLNVNDNVVKVPEEDTVINTSASNRDNNIDASSCNAVTVIASMHLPSPSPSTNTDSKITGNHHTSNHEAIEAVIIVFTGHRNGNICRWTMTVPTIAARSTTTASSTTTTTSSKDDSATTATTAATTCSSDRNNVIHVQQHKQRELPDWTITSACTDMTSQISSSSNNNNNSCSFLLSKLGIAGLVIRRKHQHQNDHIVHDTQRNDDDNKNSYNDNQKEAFLSSYLLYSWNHPQDIVVQNNNNNSNSNNNNRIRTRPERILIWNCSTSVCTVSLNIDVGRCSITQNFANPYISCILFCQLQLVLPSNTNTTTNKNDSVNPNDEIREKVWTDVILVAVQATCDNIEIEHDSSETNPITASATMNPTSTAPELAPPTSINMKKQLQQKTKKKVETGNIIPFIEATRQKLSPWCANNSYNTFVRALTTTATTTTTNIKSYKNESNDKQRTSSSSNNNIISIMEPVFRKQQQQQQEEERDDHTTFTRTLNNNICIVIWDASNPGTVLYTLPIVIPNTPTSTSPFPTHLFGVNSITVSNVYKQVFITITAATTESSFNKTKKYGVLINLPTDCNSTTNKGRQVLSTGGVCSMSSDDGIVPNINTVVSRIGDAIVVVEKNDGRQLNITPDSIPSSNVVQLNIYSLFDCQITNSSSHKDIGDDTFDFYRCIHSRNTLLLNKEDTVGLISINMSRAIIGYMDGTIHIVEIELPSPQPQRHNDNDGMNECLSCSEAPIGLMYDCGSSNGWDNRTTTKNENLEESYHYYTIPHLSSSTNQIKLQNKCTIM